MKWQFVKNYWEIQKGDFVKAVYGNLGGRKDEHIGIVERYRQDKDYTNEGYIEFQDGLAIFATQGEWLKIYKKLDDKDEVDNN